MNPRLGTSWGRFPRQPAASACSLEWRYENLPTPADSSTLLAFGKGRSYGDSCLNGGHTLIHTEQLDRIIAFDSQRGILRAEAGISLREILARTVPAGWFLPVTPGTQWVSLGGAIANDVHGKNHHQAGSFGHHVRSFELLRSDGERLLCSPTSHPHYFAATLGGLGLTGLITWAEISLLPIDNSWLQTEALCFANVDEFLNLSHQSADSYAYTVAWIDCLARGRKLGRGVFFRGNHARAEEAGESVRHGRRKQKTVVLPGEMPGFFLNRYSVMLFNQVYYYRYRMSTPLSRYLHFEPFFYPLDAVRGWNRLYGRRGFLQYQCLVPLSSASAALTEMLDAVARSGLGSFLSVVKVFGNKPSLGMLSFPRPGVTLALDFANVGVTLFRLLDRLDAITQAAGGCVYPAKDARMKGEAFRQYFPRWQEFQSYVDPRFSSSFWRRVMTS
jgi:FAD/FMN-containing dehydrogenase